MSELGDLAADLRAAGSAARPFVRKAIEVTARNIKDDWAAGARVENPEGFVRAYPSSIDYDVSEGPFRVVAEIGPDLGKRGGTAGFLEDGTVNRPPQHAGRDALESNEDDFYDGLGKAVADALMKGLGL